MFSEVMTVLCLSGKYPYNDRFLELNEAVQE